MNRQKKKERKNPADLVGFGLIRYKTVGGHEAGGGGAGGGGGAARLGPGQDLLQRRVVRYRGQTISYMGQSV
jgi:hypothetical protein